MRAPPVQAKQHGSIRIQDLTKVVMAWRRLGLTEERLVPFEAAGNVAYADDRPCAFHRISAVGLSKADRARPKRTRRVSVSHSLFVRLDPRYGQYSLQLTAAKVFGLDRVMGLLAATVRGFPKDSADLRSPDSATDGLVFLPVCPRHGVASRRSPSHARRQLETSGSASP